MANQYKVLNSLKPESADGVRVRESYRMWLAHKPFSDPAYQSERALILQLIEKVDEFCLLCAGDQQQHALEVLLPALKDSLKSRFVQEERWMSMASGDDDFEWQHLAQHREILSDLSSLCERKGQDNPKKVAGRICHYLQHHLMFHLATADRQLANRLLAQCTPSGVH